MQVCFAQDILDAVTQYACERPGFPQRNQSHLFAIRMCLSFSSRVSCNLSALRDFSCPYKIINDDILVIPPLDSIREAVHDISVSVFFTRFRDFNNLFLEPPSAAGDFEKPNAAKSEVFLILLLCASRTADTLNTQIWLLWRLPTDRFAWSTWRAFGLSSHTAMSPSGCLLGLIFQRPRGLLELPASDSSSASSRRSSPQNFLQLCECRCHTATPSGSSKQSGGNKK